MSCAPWTCDTCGSEAVEQGWSVYAPISLTYAEMLTLLADRLLRAQRDDSYWCPVCEDACNPVREERS